MPEILPDRPLLVVAADRGIGDQRQEVVLLAEAVGDGVVSGTVVELVMIAVVRRDPGKRRKSVKKRNPVVGQDIQKPGVPEGEMVVVMGNHRHGYREEEAGDEEHNVQRREAPLDEQKGGRDDHEDNRAPVGAIAEDWSHDEYPYVNELSLPGYALLALYTIDRRA
jgi:hypothetical protein